MQVIPVPAGPLRANSYLLTEDGREAVLIDCGGREPLAEAERRGLTVRCVLLTHGHFDHILGCAALQGAGAKIGCSAAERSFIESDANLAAERLKHVVELLDDIELFDTGGKIADQALRQRALARL